MNTTESFIILTEVVEREGSQFAAHCLELGTATCGDTIDEAFANLEDAITVHLSALEEVGTIGQILKERNITVRSLISEDIAWPVSVGEVVGKVVKPSRHPIPSQV